MRLIRLFLVLILTLLLTGCTGFADSMKLYYESRNQLEYEEIETKSYYYDDKTIYFTNRIPYIDSIRFEPETIYKYCIRLDKYKYNCNNISRKKFESYLEK